MTAIESTIHGFGDHYVAEFEPLSWLELAAIPEGAVVWFASDWDIFPITIVKYGTRAVVVSNHLNELSGLMEVLPDDPELRRLLEQWEGRIQLHPDYWDAEWDEVSPVTA